VRAGSLVARGARYGNGGDHLLIGAGRTRRYHGLIPKISQLASANLLPALKVQTVYRGHDWTPKGAKLGADSHAGSWSLLGIVGTVQLATCGGCNGPCAFGLTLSDKTVNG